MAYVRTKTVNGKPYYYLQSCSRVNGVVKTKHIAYLGCEKPDLRNMELSMGENQSPVVVPKSNKILDANSEYSFNKYDLSEAKVIGKGSDRIVAQLPNGDVIKIAITPRGIVQNQSEGDSYAPVPEVKDSGIDYVVVEKISQTKEDKKELRKMLKPYQEFSTDDFKNKSGKLQEQFAKTDEKYGGDISAVMNYDLMFNDFKRVSSWGFKDGEPILLDAGTLNDNIGKMNNNEEVYKEYNYTRDDWNNILQERKNTKNFVLKKSTRINN
jgi:hypothetical protein